MPLAPLTTLGVGGPARYFATASSEAHIREALDYACERDLDVFVLGGGSNVLVADQGFNGLVINIDIKGVEIIDDLSNPDFVTIRAGAGESWDELVAFAVGRDLAGFECLSGIPGSVGGTPVQNVGAYGQEVSESIISVRCFDRTNQSVVELGNAACGFSYRTSIFNSTDRDRYIVLSVDYAQIPGGQPKIAYQDLKEIFSDGRATLGQLRNAVLRIRAAKSMVLNSSDPNSRSAGSFFKNPVVEREMLAKIQRKEQTSEVPFFPFGEERVKIPAAWLMEHSGFEKGFRLGNAGISTKHTLALVNLGGASAAELILLKDAIQKRVEENFGIRLIPEPVFVGFDS